MAKQTEFDFHYFDAPPKLAFTEEQRASLIEGLKGPLPPLTLPEVTQREQAFKDVDQTRDNKDKPRLHYCLAAPSAHIAVRLLGFDDYTYDSFKLIEAAWLFMRGDSNGEDFVRDVCEVAERISGLTGAELYQQVAEFGEVKYDRGNFLKGAPVCQYLDSWLRHVQKMAGGVPVDDDSGKQHIAHVVWNTVEAARWVGHAARDNRLKVV